MTKTNNHRPRLNNRTMQLLKQVKQEVKPVAKSMDIKTVFENAQGKVTYDKIIRKALNNLSFQLETGEVEYGKY